MVVFIVIFISLASNIVFIIIAGVMDESKRSSDSSMTPTIIMKQNPLFDYGFIATVGAFLVCGLTQHYSVCV
jgi:hypothetical protein